MGHLKDLNLGIFGYISRNIRCGTRDTFTCCTQTAVTISIFASNSKAQWANCRVFAHGQEAAFVTELFLKCDKIATLNVVVFKKPSIWKL